MAKVTLYCKCGGAWTGKLGGGAKTLADLERTFWEAHDGPACGPCDAATARRARAKAEALVGKDLS